MGALLVVGRALLPRYLLRYVNTTLNRIPEYEGHVADIDVHLWRGAYTIREISLVKTGGKVPVPLFSAPRVDLSVEWRQVWHRRFVGEVEIDHPEMNFVSAATKAGTQAGVDSSWIDRVKELFPLKLNHVSVHDGAVHYRDFGSTPKIDLKLKNVDGMATNLTNRDTPGVELPASIQVTDWMPGDGGLTIEGRLAPLRPQPTFRITASVEDMSLPALDEFFRAYADVDAEAGSFAAYAEIVAKDGGFEGYVKPLIKDLKVAGHRDHESLGRKVWEEIVQLAGRVLENRDSKNVATRIPLKGRFDDPQADIWATIGALLRNAFIQALRPGIDGLLVRSVPAAAGAKPDKDGKHSKHQHRGKG